MSDFSVGEEVVYVGPAFNNYGQVSVFKYGEIVAIKKIYRPGDLIKTRTANYIAGTSFYLIHGSSAAINEKNLRKKPKPQDMADSDFIEALKGGKMSDYFRKEEMSA